MNKNYYEYKIPTFDRIKEILIDLPLELESIKRFNFNDFFSVSRKNEFEARKDFINKEIGFNHKRRNVDKINNCIKGLYIFYKKINGDYKPIYVGISRNIIRRIKQHFTGKTPNQASLVYTMARDDYDKKIELYTGQRKDFPLDDYRDDIQNDMIENWGIGIIPETDSYILYLKEILISCFLGTYWNSFETH